MHPFSLNPVHLAIKSVLLTGLVSISGNVYANDGEPKDKTSNTVIKTATQNVKAEIIQVKGVRGSMVKSLNNKRFSDAIVDVISAEDVGKFRDQNVAESL